MSAFPVVVCTRTHLTIDGYDAVSENQPFRCLAVGYSFCLGVRRKAPDKNALMCRAQHGCVMGAPHDVGVDAGALMYAWSAGFMGSVLS